MPDVRVVVYIDAEGRSAFTRWFEGLNAEAAARYARQFPKIAMFTIDDTFGGWRKAQARHFNDGGVFDQIYKP